MVLITPRSRVRPPYGPNSWLAIIMFLKSNVYLRRRGKYFPKTCGDRGFYCERRKQDEADFTLAWNKNGFLCRPDDRTNRHFCYFLFFLHFKVGKNFKRHNFYKSVRIKNCTELNCIKMEVRKHQQTLVFPLKTHLFNLVFNFFTFLLHLVVQTGIT